MSMSIDAESVSREHWVEVCPVDAIAPNTGVCALVGGRHVACFRVGEQDEVYAISSFDPFSRANVLARGIVGDRGGEPKVASPIHKQTFSLRTGICFDEPSVKIATFEVRIRGGVIEVGHEVTTRSHFGNEARL
jgi:nitrite reductase (NADH) small subunit